MSSNIEIQNPLMQPVQYNSQLYFTSHYFHLQYKGNLGSKYLELKNFNALIRSMEAYDVYVGNNNIIELSWRKVKNSGVENLSPLFESNTYNPIMLLDSIAQIALTHHLDDEISKSISVSVNTQASESITQKTIASKKPPTLSFVAKELKAAKEIAKLLGFENVEADMCSVRIVKNYHNFDLPQIAELEFKPSTKDKYLIPKTIGPIFGISSQAVNKMLKEKGFQFDSRGADGQLVWNLTEKGKEFGELGYAEKSKGSGTPVPQIHWHPSIVNELSVAEVA